MAELPRSHVLAALKKVPMFSALDSAATGRLLDECRPLHVRAGAMVFGPTQKADRFYVVLCGQVKIYQISARGDEQIFHLYGPGETFGEAAMWAGVHYPAFAQALEESHLLGVSRQSLHRLIAANADLAMEMMAGLSAKLREFNRLIEDLTLKEVPARIAGRLLKEMAVSGTATITLKQTKRQLAAQIGTVAETLSRALGKMKTDGVIAVRGSAITILDKDALEDLARNG